MSLFGVARRLGARGIMGMNRRNALYVGPLNPRRAYPLVDDKRRTKALAAGANIPTPELYAVIDTQRRARDLGRLVAGREEFVVKPARGSGGSGIVLVVARDADGVTKPSGARLGWDDLVYHVASILSGVYSLEGLEDHALIEALVHADPVFERVSWHGVPDVRVIVYRGVPIMAMVRLPTRRSDGRANLHQGALGAGISLGAGVTGTAVRGREVVTHHPDTGEAVAGIRVPAWARILEYAAQAWDMTGLGYLGADFVIDRARGPVLLELNARPGLAIQLANRDGLARRLGLVDAALGDDLPPPLARVAIARGLFP